MATSALVRITGTILRTERIQGISRNSGEPYDFTQGKVLTADMDVTEFTLPRDMSVLRSGTPGKGEEVDYLAEARINSSGKGLNINIVSDFPVDSLAGL